MVIAPEEIVPYLEGIGPNDMGEWGMYCPFHDDTRRSASVNFEKGKWFCHGCDVGGDVEDLLERLRQGQGRLNGVTAPALTVPTTPLGDATAATPLPSTGTLAGWVRALAANANLLSELMLRRGLEESILEYYEVGWDAAQAAYTIPVYDAAGYLVNVRFYQLDPPDDRRKIWSVKGHGAPALYPIDQLEENGPIVICEGEWDALLSIQHGVKAITRTASADTWKPAWNQLFTDRTVYICHDMDEKGQLANEKIHDQIATVTDDVTILDLPYPVTEKHGKDLTDFWQDGHTFEELLQEQLDDLKEISLLDSFGAEARGVRRKLKASVLGRGSETFMTPSHATFQCDMNAGTKCTGCSMNSRGFAGQHELVISKEDPIALAVVGGSEDNKKDVLRKRIRATKACGHLQIKVDDYHAVEMLYVRPDLDSAQFIHDAAGYQPRKIFSVGKHDTMPNSTVEMRGAIYPHPRDQINVFLADTVKNTATSLDTFEMTPELFQDLKKTFYAYEGQPLEKIEEISHYLAQNVTGIHGRPEMHMLLDLAWHSVLSFEYGGAIQRKGWLDVLVFGDTRTGKSEAAEQLARHYRMGEIVSCESASFAGIVGGLEQYGGREWITRWGAIPLNDRRLVVLDEISGLEPSQIGQMSSIRSSGEAQLTKIHSERTLARTRLVWMGNPRNNRMDAYHYGVQGIVPLVGNAEDIARFDLAMSVSSKEVSADLINDEYVRSENNPYTSDLCHQLVLWVWSLKPYQIYWHVGAQDLIREAAKELGQRYVEYPPLVQVANMRFKIARVAAALAARTFNTQDGVQLRIHRKHVTDAVKFIERLYSMAGFGYADLSKRIFEEEKEAVGRTEEAKVFIHNQPGLEDFLRSQSSFKRQDLQDMLNMTQDLAGSVTSDLWNMRMVRKELGTFKVNPVLHDILRGEA